MLFIAYYDLVDSIFCLKVNKTLGQVELRLVPLHLFYYVILGYYDYQGIT